MKIAQRSANRIAVISAFLSTIALLAAFPWLLTNIFSATYLPHGFCFMWNPQLLWLHVISDVVIGVSYLVIAATLAWLIQTCRREVPFQSIFIAFGAFILACGFTHLIAVVVLWKPLYWLEGDVKLLTACASLLTAVVLPIYLPRIREMVKSAKVSAENERRFLAAANSSLDSVYILKSERSVSGEIEDFTFLFVNPNAARLISRQPQQILGQRICELIPFNRSSGLFDKYKQVVETGVGFKEEFSISDKEIRASWLKIQAVKLDDGVAITSSDITARKRLEFERTKAFTQSLIDSSPATIIVTDLSYTITAINPAAQRMLWYKPEELLGKQTPLIFYDVDELEERSAKLSDKFGTHVSVNEVVFFISRAQNVDDEAEWNFIRKGGSRLAVQVTVTPLVGEGAEDSGFMITAYDVSERKRREEYISHIAQHDSLTGLPTRHLLFDRLEMTIARAKRAKSICALLMLDVNDFKGVNDSFGHHAGDVLLVQMASRFRTSLRATDTVARMGGDEFVILLDDLHSVDEAVVIANQLCDAISSPFTLSPLSTISVSISVGISVYPESGSDAGSLLRNADVAMYQAKSVGQPYIEVYTPALAQSSLHKQEVAAGLRDALRNGEFELHYQPQLDLKEVRVLGFECLLRWTNPRLGSVSPSIFIPIAEETGLIQPIGAWVVKQACKDLRRIQTRFTDELFVSVNISPRQVEQKKLLQIIADAIEESQIAPGTLEIEITEGVLMKDSATTTALLDGLRKLGPRIAIDDFGTGFSNMSYLFRLPIDCLKIDRSIVDGCSTGSSTSTITSAIIALAHQLNLCVVAEGAELREEVQFLKTQDCDRVQGFYFSKALSLDTILAMDLDSLGQRKALEEPFKEPIRSFPHSNDV
jgi:diguanylate cyclase (GGDEF)-like protein/PAS domain S-box-containing protein